LWTFAANSFAAPQIRLQAERGQRVIDTGPYAFVRHPMYAGGAVYLLGMALLLGSWWGLLGAALLIVTFGLRAVGEEKMLRAGLAGYEDYARRVPYRFLPGVW
jgi:protein-S-isoprenylcysteine O-methyltransferase Ste14